MPQIDRELFGIGCNALLFNKDDILLLRRVSSSNYRPNKWDFPGGRIEKGEDLIRALSGKEMKSGKYKPLKTSLKNVQTKVNKFKREQGEVQS